MKKVFSIWLAFIFLLANTGVVLGRHYCGGKLHKSGIVWNSSSLSCNMMPAEEEDCNSLPAEDSYTNNCCKNEFQNVSITKDYQASDLLLKKDAAVSLLLVVSYLDLILEEEVFSSQYHNYSPPLLVADVPVLTGSFRL